MGSVSWKLQVLGYDSLPESFDDSFLSAVDMKFLVNILEVAADGVKRNE